MNIWTLVGYFLLGIAIGVGVAAVAGSLILVLVSWFDHDD
jgi:hypothetical protein